MLRPEAPEGDKATLAEQINAFRTELFYKLINNETEIKIQIGSQEMSIKEWDKELETIHEALLEKEEKQSEKEQEERIRKLFEDRNANEEMTNVVGA
ncbi:MAG: hypothetical protein E7307_05635 [Butyrivibrio sp.]|nr:hypothetical protein [Butyrivibrio sp.]